MNTKKQTSQSTDWTLNDQPMYKISSFGKEHLSDSELLSIVLGSQSSWMNSLGIARSIMEEVQGDLARLSRLSLKEYCSKFKGIGNVRAAKIMAAIELGKRRTMTENLKSYPKFTSSKDVYNYIYPVFSDLQHEEVWVLYINSANRLIERKRLSKGGISECTVDPRILLKDALLCNASGLFLCHNHPSGNNQPSEADDRLTKRINEACKMMSIVFIDHVIVCDGRYYSYADQGKL